MAFNQNGGLTPPNESAYKGLSEQQNKRSHKVEYEIIFEGEYGEEMVLITAKNRRAAIEQLKKEYPNDIGADGIIINENGDEFPLNW